MPKVLFGRNTVAAASDNGNDFKKSWRKTRRFDEQMVPAEGIEPPTFGLQNRCSTAELSRRLRPLAYQTCGLRART
jgi:hypothetical protein